MISIYSPPELRFQEQEHRYTVGGITVPSVSDIIRGDPEGESYAGIPDAVLARAAHRGTMVHSAIQEYVESGCKEDPWHDDKSTHPYLMAFNDFIRLGVFQPVHSETKLYHPDLWYAGTIDLMGYYNGKPAILDIKTTSKYLERKCCMQLAGYGILVGFYDRNFDRNFDRIVLRLDRNYGPKVHRIEDPVGNDRDFMGLLDGFSRNP